MTKEEFHRFMDARGEAHKSIIEAQSGPSFSLNEASARAGVSPEQMAQLVRENAAIGYVGIGSREDIRLPQWQFTFDGKLHSWIRPLSDAFGGNGWALIDFVTAPRRGVVIDREFSGSLLTALLAGDVDLVLAAARRSNPP